MQKKKYIANAEHFFMKQYEITIPFLQRIDSIEHHEKNSEQSVD